MDKYFENASEENDVKEEINSDNDTKEKNTLAYEFRNNMVDDSISLKDLLDPTRGMARVFENEVGGGVYACRYQESTTRKGYIMFIVKYKDGQCSEPIYVSQTDFLEIHVPMVIKRNELNWLKKSKSLCVLMHYCSEDMNINYLQVFFNVRSAFQTLPTKIVTKKSPVNVVYQAVIDRALEKSNNDKDDTVSVREESYNLTTKDINEIIDDHGYTMKEFIQLMVHYNILKTDKDERYQYSIKTNGVKCRYYSFWNINCLRKIMSSSVEEIIIPNAQLPKDIHRVFRK